MQLTWLFRRFGSIGVCVLSLSLFCTPGFAVSKSTLTFAVNAPGSHPQLYFDSDHQEYRGIVVDLFKSFENTASFSVEFVDSNQLRSEDSLLSGTADLYLANPGWLLYPEKVLLSEPLMNHLTYLYATSPFESNFDISALDGARICTRENWVYTGLTASFEQDSMVRVDTNSLKNMATMLIADRCDYMVMSNDNAVKMFSYPETCNKAIYQSPMPTSEITLHIVVRSSLNAVKAEIDDAIRLFKQTGSFMQSYQIHGQRPQFPKPSSC